MTPVVFITKVCMSMHTLTHIHIHGGLGEEKERLFVTSFKTYLFVLFFYFILSMPLFFVSEFIIMALVCLHLSQLVSNQEGHSECLLFYAMGIRTGLCRLKWFQDNLCVQLYLKSVNTIECLSLNAFM